MTSTYTVAGMTCSHCVASVSEEVAEVAGVDAVDVDLGSGRLAVTGDDVSDAAVRAAVAEAGYEVVGMSAATRLVALRRPPRRALRGGRGRRRRARPRRPGRGARGRRRPTPAAPSTAGDAEARRATQGAAEVHGLAVADDAGLQLERPHARAAPRPRAAPRLPHPRRAGAPVRDYDVEHERRMHLIVVRRDLTGFQHLHPELRADGTWATPIALPDAGSYRVFADFSHDGEAHDARRRPARRRPRRPARRCPRRRRPPPPATATTVRARRGRRARRRGGRAALHGHARRRARRDRALPRRGRPPGRAARGRPRLPARAPDRTALGFMATFPSPGRYRLFLQFKHEGVVRTAAFTQAVATMSARARPPRAADHGHDLRVVREPDRAQAQQARRRAAPA